MGSKARYFGLGAALLMVGSLPLWAGVGCVRDPAPRPQIQQPFRDDFERAELGTEWLATNNSWSIVEGHLRVSNARNHPLWLRRRLPRNARIEFDAWSGGPDGDIKCEAWGDGRSFAREASYTATSYVVIFGGWRNSLNAIARMDEHAPDRRVVQVDPRANSGPTQPVVPGRHYHWAVERNGNTVRWSIDGQPMLENEDANPLAGPGHEYFAFNDWSVELNFDNLVITPL